MTETTHIETDGSGDSDNDDVDGNALGEQLREFEEGDEIELYVNGNDTPVRIQGVVTDVHTTPGNPGGLVADFEEQFSINLEDHSYSEPGDIRAWNISTQYRDGEWSQPSAAGWVEEEDDFYELSAQWVTELRQPDQTPE